MSIEDVVIECTLTDEHSMQCRLLYLIRSPYFVFLTYARIGIKQDMFFS